MMVQVGQVEEEKGVQVDKRRGDMVAQVGKVGDISAQAGQYHPD